MQDLHIPGFRGVLVTEVLADGRTLRIARHFGFHSRTGTTYWARAGDEVNGASIPRFLWRAVGSPFVGKYRRAACIHDSEYRHKVRDRAPIDAAFREAMVYDGVAGWKAWLMWAAVRCFGWVAWRRS